MNFLPACQPQWYIQPKAKGHASPKIDSVGLWATIDKRSVIFYDFRLCSPTILIVTLAVGSGISESVL